MSLSPYVYAQGEVTSSYTLWSYYYLYVVGQHDILCDVKW